MKRTILSMALLLVVISSTWSGERVLSTTKVLCIKTSVPCDLDLRYVPEGITKGTWLDIKQNDRVFLCMDTGLKDSILTYLYVYQKWAQKAKSSGADIAKDIAQTPVRCLYTVALSNESGFGQGDLIFRFFSTKASYGVVNTYLLILYNDIEPQRPADKYHNIRIEGMMLSDEMALSFLRDVQNMEANIAKAIRQNQVADEFTR